MEKGDTMETSITGAVFVQTNAAHNEVIAYARDDAGMLTGSGTFATGGAGDAGDGYRPTGTRSFTVEDSSEFLIFKVRK